MLQSCKVEAFKATEKLRQRQPKMLFFWGFRSNATLFLVTFGMFWALGAKVGGVSAFRVVSISIELLRVGKLQG